MLNLSPSTTKNTAVVGNLLNNQSIKLSDFGHTTHCKRCAIHSAKRTQRTMLERYLSQVITIKAYRCDNCHQRFLKRA